MDANFLKIVSKALKTSPDHLDEFSTPNTVKGWDSLNHWVLISELEEAYDIEFTMEEATEFKNLEDLYCILKRKTS